MGFAPANHAAVSPAKTEYLESPVASASARYPSTTGPRPYAICGNQTAVPLGETDDATWPASMKRDHSPSASRFAAAAKSGRFKTTEAIASASVERDPQACQSVVELSDRAPHGAVYGLPFDRRTSSVAVSAARAAFPGGDSARSSARRPSSASAVAVDDPPIRRPAFISRASLATARFRVGRIGVNDAESRGPRTRSASPSAQMLRAAQNDMLLRLLGAFRFSLP